MKFNRYFSSRIIGRACTALLTLCTISANAQRSEPVETPNIITFTAAEGLHANDAAQILASRLHLNAGADELRSVYIEQPGDGLQVQRFNQYFKGIRVEHGTYTLSSKNGVASYAFGKFYPTGAVAGTTPLITEAAALDKGLEFTHAEKYAWEDGSAEYPTGTLTLVEDFGNGDGDGVLHLAYAFDIYAVTPLSRNMVYVDAQSGKILLTDAILKHVNATGSTLYSDTVAFKAGQIGTLIYLHDSTRGKGIYTFNLNHATSVPSLSATLPANSPYQITSATTFFDQDAAIDAHWGAQQVYDYWKNTHNRLSYNGRDSALRSYVHYRTNYNNASWNGSYMLYGDGSGTAAGGLPPLTSLDVCGHEIGHGVCQTTAGLVYRRESGAMNEGFSDIWGAVIEAYADPHEIDAIAKNTWLIGEELTNTLRSMSNPKQFGQPDTYLGNNWVYAAPACSPNSTTNDNCGVHTNSGVLNYWFYLLSVGGKDTNDLGKIYEVPAIGLTKAAKIAYATELALNSTADYALCRTASIAAATTIYGACSPEVEAVTRAWYAVGVGNNYTPCTPQVSFNAQAGRVSEDASVNACRPTRLVSVPVALDGTTPLTGSSATVTAVVIGGTAVAGVDYDLTTPSVTFTVGGAATQSIGLTVYDNGALNTSKYVDLTFTLSAGSSNATKSAYLDTTRVYIADDDYAPYAGINEQRKVLGSNTLANNGSPFSSSVLSNHSQYIYNARELTAAGVRPGIPITSADFYMLTKRSTKPFSAYTMMLAHTQQGGLNSSFINTGFTTVYSDTLSSAPTGRSPVRFSTPFTWNGTDNLVVDICFTNTGTPDTANDRVQAQTGGYAFGAYVSSNTGSACGLPYNVNNMVNNRPVIWFTQSTSVETALNGTRTWEVKAGQQVYFYSDGPKKLIAAVLNATDSLGCVTATVTAAGNGFVPASGGARRSVKEFMITPTRQSAGISYDGIFYLSNAELAGVDPYSLYIVQSDAVNDNAMLPGNTKMIVPTDVYLGLEYTAFRGTFTGFNRFFLADRHLALNVNGPTGKAAELWTGVNPFHTAPVLFWNLSSSERVSIRLYDVTGKLIYGTEQTLASGTHQMSVSGNADFAPGTYVLQVVRPSGVFTKQLVKQ